MSAVLKKPEIEWELLAPPRIGSSKAAMVKASIQRRVQSLPARLSISVPKAIYADLGWVPGGRFTLATGKGANVGFFAIWADENGQFLGRKMRGETIGFSLGPVVIITQKVCSNTCTHRIAGNRLIVELPGMMLA